MIVTGLVILVIIALNLALVVFLLIRDTGPIRPLWALLVPIVIGLAAAQVAGSINSILEPLVGGQLLSLSSAVIVGIVPGLFEELLKVIPIIFFVQSEKFFSGLVDGVIYFSLSGIGFGLYENIQYTLAKGAGVGLQRVFTVLFFHAATSGIFGYWYAHNRLDKSRFHWLGLFGVAVLLIATHFVYNFSIAIQSVWPFMTIVALAVSLSLSCLLIWLYLKALTHQYNSL